MADRILDFSDEPAHLSVRYANLVIKCGSAESGELTIPLADIAAVLLAQPRVTITLAALSGLATAGASVVVCDEKRLPAGMLLPLQAHFTQTERIASQMAAKQPLKKRLWQALVKAKITAQATALARATGDDRGIAKLVGRVRSGDPDNVEAQAARRYWGAFFDMPRFKRVPEQPGLNALLNYGYAVLRAVTARAVCSVGLHPSVGVHHHNRYSSFTLADDVMEPFRPVVDLACRSIAAHGDVSDPLSKTARGLMLESLFVTFLHHGERRTLFDILARVATSLADSFKTGLVSLDLPDARRLIHGIGSVQ